MKDWKAYKEEGEKIVRYLRHGGRPVIRKAPAPGPGRATHKAGTEVSFPEGYQNRETRRAEAKKSRKIKRTIKRAKARGQDPNQAIRRLLEGGRKRSPFQRPVPLPPFVPPQRGWIGRTIDYVRDLWRYLCGSE